MALLHEISPKILVPESAGLYFGEAPRWHNGKLFFADMIGQKIYALDLSGKLEVFLEVPNQPNGMCFMPDGSLIYSSMFDAKLYRYYNGQIELFADLSSLMTGYCGDMVIDAAGRVFIDDTGARVLHGEKPCPGRLLVVDTDRSVKVAAENLVFPNGVTIDREGTSLYIAETFAYRINKFNLSESGELTNRQEVWDATEWARLRGTQSEKFSSVDGFCMDKDNGMWLSLLADEVFARRDPEKGMFTHMIKVDGHATACTLGGDDGKTLFMLANITPKGDDLFTAMVERRTRCIVLTATVDVGHGDARP
ncbi:hypothetical protein VE01_04445 [Pseudogymnoascus verrucosus]|uniref:SMP-30/Gluconolactonase/LRE-like region domain-containing protein n=1 Tax=Pseudogymnoascus verrucosus TaxID=342668 RepID=A0A1B8GP05_9PEZI|nr:uncharacterized protein VE01_04445 [Pseudogymnoascus verrucosus]OBT97575.1 hypothetical protein VE01_04445 [Pseudogymnoascus verrucosus]